MNRPNVASGPVVRWDVDPVLVGASIVWVGPSRRHAIAAKLAALALSCAGAIGLLWLGPMSLGPAETSGELFLVTFVVPTLVTFGALMLSRPIAWLFGVAPSQPSSAKVDGEFAVLLREYDTRELRARLTREVAIWTVAVAVLAVALIPSSLWFIGPLAMGIAFALLVHVIAFVRWRARLSIAVLSFESQVPQPDSPDHVQASIKKPARSLRVGERAYADPFGGYPRTIRALASNPNARRGLIEAGVPMDSLPPIAAKEGAN